ncbi:hypothetical protein GCM10027521_02180 [Amycolatopsis cihanbeyliensis]
MLAKPRAEGPALGPAVAFGLQIPHVRLIGLAGSVAFQQRIQLLRPDATARLDMRDLLLGAAQDLRRIVLRQPSIDALPGEFITQHDLHHRWWELLLGHAYLQIATSLITHSTGRFTRLCVYST